MALNQEAEMSDSLSDTTSVRNTVKSGVVDVGGGLRGIYAAGVFDRCMDDGVEFDVALGISAGSANICSYIAKQWGRNFRSYNDYAFRKEYMSLQNFLKSGSYINMDYVYSTLTNSDGEDPMDYETFSNSNTDWRIIAANAITGESKYFGPDSMSQDNYDPPKASCSIPLICKPYEIDGELYYDGALGDTIPIEAAFEMGCTKVVLILTRPADFIREPGSDVTMARLIEHKYPVAAERPRTRADRYNYGVELAKELEKEGLVLIVAPKETFGVDTLTRDHDALESLYLEGYFDGGKIKDFLSA